MSGLWCNSLSHHQYTTTGGETSDFLLFCFTSLIATNNQNVAGAPTDLEVVTAETISEGCPWFPYLKVNRLSTKLVWEKSKALKPSVLPNLTFIHAKACVLCSQDTLCTIKLSPSPQKQSSQMRRPRSTAGCSGTPLRTHWEPSVITALAFLFRLPGKGTSGKCPQVSNAMVRGDWPGASPGRQSPKSTV